MATATLEVVPQSQPIQRRTLEPNTLAEAKEFAEIAAKSDLVPKDYRGHVFNVLIAIQFGKELGVPPMQALQGIAVINGRPAVWGDLQLALIVSHPDFEDIAEDDMADIKTAQRATCIIKRRGRHPVKRSFSVEDAKSANLWAKDGPWKTYPYRMLQMRARGFALRDSFPDALKGLVSAEEAGDYHDGPTIEGSRSTASAAQSFDTATPPAEDKIITQDQAREFGKAWKATGKTIDQAKAFLKETFGLDTSLKLRESQYAKAMAWANPAPAASSPAAEAPITPDKKLAFELFTILGYDAVRQAKTVQEHNSDWTKIVSALNAELPEEK